MNKTYYDAFCQDCEWKAISIDREYLITQVAKHENKDGHYIAMSNFEYDDA